LIELLVVISVMSLLMSISLPAFHRARLVAKRTKCMANLRSIGQGIKAYLMVHDERYPYAAGYPLLKEDLETYCRGDPEDEGCLLPPIYEAIGTEIGHQRKVFLCPADKIREADTLENRPNRITYFASIGTSYEWDTFYNGKRVGKTPYTGPQGASQEAGLGWFPSQAPMMYDYEAFHGGPEVISSLVTLFADLHVATDKWTEPATVPEEQAPSGTSGRRRLR
jgi:type II secretory pathway pseudopilin PulG